MTDELVIRGTTLLDRHGPLLESIHDRDLSTLVSHG
jgi:hypothetical protein